MVAAVQSRRQSPPTSMFHIGTGGPFQPTSSNFHHLCTHTFVLVPGMETRCSQCQRAVMGGGARRGGCSDHAIPPFVSQLHAFPPFRISFAFFFFGSTIESAT
eukprot:GGOE01031289.1.p2 GENE.GGOE01031289.1~~GGOE01031289.1.p2  ORF type:complete len:103 (-),score=11.74 GGOE01031289.1:234-542(-)